MAVIPKLVAEFVAFVCEVDRGILVGYGLEPTKEARGRRWIGRRCG